MAKPGMTVSRWIDGVTGEERAHRPGSQPARDHLLGPCAEQPVARLRDARGDEEARPDGGASIRIRRRPPRCSRWCARTASTCCRSRRSSSARVRSPASNRSIQWREKVIDPMFESRTDHMIMYQLAQKLGFARPVRRQEGRQAEHQAGEGQGRRRAVDGRHAARDQPRHLDHRLHRPVARAHAGAHAQHARVRRQDAALQGRQGREDRLRHDRATTSACRGRATAPQRSSIPGTPNLYDTLQAPHGRRRQLPRAVRRREGRRQPARRGRRALEGQRHHHRLPAVRPRAAEEARLVGRTHRGREEGGRRQDLGERPLRRHPARGA